VKADRYVFYTCILIAGFLLGQWSVPEAKLGACVEMPGKVRSLSQDQGAWIKFYRSKAQ
jgi:hypothetical protein